MAFPGKFYREGNRIKLQNFSGDPKIFIIEEFSLIHHFNEEVFSWLDKIVACGVNGIRVLGIYVWDHDQAQQPFRRINPDYSCEYNEDFFNYMRRWVKYAAERGVVIIYDLFDRCLFADWAPLDYAMYDPFYPVINGNCAAFTDLGNASLIALQKNYIRKVVETVKSLNVPNVIFSVMNEFLGNEAWYYEMSRYIKDDLGWGHLLAGSGSYAATMDPRVDMWFVHTGNRDFLQSGVPHIAEDIDKLRGETGEGKSLGFSNDGFGDDGPRENPDDMRRLAAAAVNKGLQLFAFMDHLAARREGEPVTGKLHSINEATYRAIAEVFQPAPRATSTPGPLPDPGTVPAPAQFKLDDQSFTSLKKKNVPADVLKKLGVLKGKAYTAEADFVKALEKTLGKAPLAQYKPLILKYATIGRSAEGWVDIFKVAALPSGHRGAFGERGGRAIRATTEQGFLCYGPYKTGYATARLQAVFSLLVDNNTADDREILTIDVYDQQSVLARKTITRKMFRKANAFCVFSLDFTPSSKDARMEFRIFYMGYSYVLADKIAIVDPSLLTITDASQIPDSLTSPTTPTTPGSGTLVIDDPLTTGRSACNAILSGGNFTAGGYQITAERNAGIIYVTDIYKYIRIEFDAQGYIDREPLIGTDDNFFVMMMHDHPDVYANWFMIWRDAPNFLYQLRKIGEGPTPNGISFKAGCYPRNAGFELASWNGDCLAGRSIEWNPAKKYHWVITVSQGRTTVVRDNVTLFSADCTTAFNPDNRLVVCLGGATFGPQSPKNVTYANVKIYRLPN